MNTPRPERAEAASAALTQWFIAEVQPHEPLLRAYLQKNFPHLHDVDDIVQESHLRLLQARERRAIACAKAYLFAIARHVALGLFRRQRTNAPVRAGDLRDWRVMDDTRHGAETACLEQEASLALEAIDGLPARCREIVVLRVLHGASHREIAARLGVAEETVRVQVARGMKRCSEYLRARGVVRPHHP